MEDSAATAGQDAASAQELLLGLGHALLKGETWESVFNHPLHAWHSLYIAYTHDKLGTPDQVEGVFFGQDEAEALVEKVARDFGNSQPWQRPFYKFKVANWPLGALAIRDARDSFHRGVVRQVVGLIKQALQRHGKLPRGVAAVAVGNASVAALPAFIDLSGRRIVLWEDCSDAASAEDSVAFATCGKSRLSGLMNGCGDIVVAPAFQKVAPLRHGLAVAVQQGKYGYIDASGNVVVPFLYEDAADCCQDLLLVKSDGLWGALDRDGQEVITPRFAALAHDVGNEALCATLDGRHGYLSLTGELLAGYSERPLLLVEHAFVGERAVFIARDAAAETKAEPGTGSDAARQMLVDALGRPCGTQYFAAINYGAHDEGILCACTGDAPGARHGYIGLHGETVIDFRFAAAEGFSEGLAAVAEMAAPTRYGYIDRRGNWAIAPQFDYAGPFHHGLAVASAAPPGPGWRTQLRELVQAWSNQLLATPASQPPANAAPGRRYGYIDRRGRWAIAPRYLEAKAFSEGLAPVRTERGWCYIDTCGVPVTPAHYQEAGPFKRGVARVGRRFDGPMRFGLVDSNGREIIPPRFERLSYPQRGMVTARDEFGLWGCFTLYGNIVAPFIYREAHDLQIALAARGHTQVT